MYINQNIILNKNQFFYSTLYGPNIYLFGKPFKKCLAVSISLHRQTILFGLVFMLGSLIGAIIGSKRGLKGGNSNKLEFGSKIDSGKLPVLKILFGSNNKSFGSGM